MKITYLVANEPGNVTLGTEIFDETKLPDDQIIVKIDYGAISAGTECAWIAGRSNNSGQSFPFYPGYSTTGRVIQTGKNVTEYAAGDRLIVPWSHHRSHVIVSEAESHIRSFYKITNPEISLKEAAFCPIGSFPMLGVRRLMLQMGESLMIAGLGILGQLALQIARMNGAAPIFVCDLDPKRRELALKMGADAAFDPAAPDFIDQVKKASGGTGIAAVIEVTGQAAALQQALKYTARMGRICLLGCTRVPENIVDFYRDVHCTGITLIGCHTSARPNTDSRPGQWTYQDDFHTLLCFMETGRIRIAPLISQTVSPKDAHDVYDMLLHTKNPPMGIVFDWSMLE